MKIVINQLGERYLKFFLFIVFGLPVIIAITFASLSLFGLHGVSFQGLLMLNYAFFMPAHAVLGNFIVSVQEFGPIPGITGIAATVLLYFVICLLAANLIGVLWGNRNAS